MTLSWTYRLSPEITDATATTVVTAMMIPTRVRKLLSLCARIDSSEARRSSPRLTSAPRRRLLVRLGLTNEIARLQHAQLLERTGDQLLAFFETVRHLDGQLAEQSRGDRLEDGLPTLDQEDAFLLLGRGRGRRISRLSGLGIAHHQGLQGDGKNLRAEPREDVGLNREARLDPLRRGFAVPPHL